jgi:hypothetical protein
MLSRARVNPPTYSPERRRGYIDPREHDDPPFSPGHPFKNKKGDCIYCSPGRFPYKDKDDLRPHTMKWPCLTTMEGNRSFGLRQKPEVEQRRYLVPSGLRSASPIACRDPHSRSLPNQLVSPCRSPITPVSWPFLRLSASSKDRLIDDHESRSKHSNRSTLGPLGALIAELNSRPASAHVITPFFFLVLHERRDDFTQQDMRQIWAHWVMKRGCKGGEGRGEVRGSGARLVEVETDRSNWASAALHGWI